jgi:hypothetical protein
MTRREEKEQIFLGRWTIEGLDSLLGKSYAPKSSGKRIEFLSGNFLGVQYRESTLIGGPATPEEFVVNLEGVDCFTFLDYIEAMRLSGSFAEFKDNLKKVRYRSGEIRYEDRNHFFTNWHEFNPDRLDDITGLAGDKKTRSVIRNLNLKEDGTYILMGVRSWKRTLHFIPSGAVDDSVMEKLKTGDYIGIYSEKQGLDVSHVGILIKKDGTAYLRHASSSEKHRQVVDEDFREYIKDKPGIIVLRPKQIE